MEMRFHLKIYICEDFDAFLGLKLIQTLLKIYKRLTHTTGWIHWGYIIMIYLANKG